MGWLKRCLQRRKLYQERLALAVQRRVMVDDDLHDPIEDDPAFQPMIDEADAMAEAQLSMANHDMGYCHVFWRTKQRILEKRFGIVWFSPADMNPHCLYD